MARHHALTVHTRKRSGSGALKALRREGLVPGVLYGRKQENVNVRVNRRAIESVLSHSVSEQILVNLTIEDLGQTKLALIQDVQHDPLNGAILHLDFHAVSEDEVIHASVPVELVGDAAGAKQGGLVEHLVHNLEIHCLPKDLPETISVDVTSLAIGDALHVKELKLPAGVNTSVDGDVVVVHVTEPRVSEASSSGGAEAAPAAAGEKK
jgi:large subunit ribosomal protein L25